MRRGAFILLAKIALAILAGFGPLFILALLFKSTSRFFEAWCGQVLSYGLLVVLISAVFGVMMQMFTGFMDSMKVDESQNLFWNVGGCGCLALACVVIVIQIPSIAASLANGVGIGLWHELRIAAGMPGKAAGAAKATGRGVASTYSKGKAAAGAVGNAAGAVSRAVGRFKGSTRGSLAKIAAVAEIKNDGERRAALVRDFIALAPAERDATLIVSGTNEARREINTKVREAIGTAGQGREYDTLIRRDTTQAERRFSKNYHVGDVIQPEKNYKTGLQRGELYRVLDTGPGNRLTVAGDDGRQITFSPLSHTKLSVYQPERSELAIGDTIRITRNDAGLDLANGDRFKVAEVAPGKLTIEGAGRRIELPADKPMHLDLAYATTVHSAQGLTSNRVMIEAQTNSRTTAKDVYYVAISRARHEARIYTNDRSKLPAAIARENQKLAALDLTREKQGRERTADLQRPGIARQRLRQERQAGRG
jgi:hypothetical protein